MAKINKEDKLKVGIATDTWKVKIFKKELKKLGYEYETSDGITPEDKFFYIYVEPNKLEKAQSDIAYINQKARNSRMN